MKRTRHIIGTTLLVIVSTLIAAVAVELASRLFLDPVDYLKPRLVSDDVLKHRIEPGSGGHDGWGFRNAAVPDSVDIVAIGDSQTYGIAATSGETWPADLERLSSRSVYNLSLGGYGPLQYLHLLRTRALRLNPSLVIVALYYGNDLVESYVLAYHNDYWASFRDSTYAAARDSIEAARNAARKAEPGHAGATRPNRPLLIRRLLKVREWLTYHSVLYRFVFEASPLGRFLRARETYRVPESAVTRVDIPAAGVHTKLASPLRREAVDLDDPGVREGVRMSIEALGRMKETADSAGVQLLVALIPTKERVYAEFIEGRPELPHADVIDEVIANERRINNHVKATLDSMNIDTVDVTPALQSAARREQIYPVNWNSHPNAAGYRVIAGAILDHLSLSN